jgi:uncharacterized protein (DUF2164 family)
MEEIKRKRDVLSKERRKSCIEEIIPFFKKERNEEIGIIAAGDILDFFLQVIGPDLYNKGVEDSKNLLKGRLEDLEFDLEALKRLPNE